MALLDLVALATVCDVMPLTGVNRALVCQGLKVMAPPRAARHRRAAGRGADARPADRLHLRLRPGAAHQRRRPDQRGRSRAAAAAGEDPVEAVALADALDGVNRQRQEVEAAVLDAALSAAEAQAAAGHAALLVCGAGLASRRGRHRRRADQGAVQPAGLRRRDRRRRRQGLRPLGAGARPGGGGDRGAPGGHPDDRRRPSAWRRGFRWRRRGSRRSTPS